MPSLAKIGAKGRTNRRRPLRGQTAGLYVLVSGNVFVRPAFEKQNNTRDTEDNEEGREEMSGISDILKYFQFEGIALFKKERYPYHPRPRGSVEKFRTVLCPFDAPRFLRRGGGGIERPLADDCPARIGD